MIVVRPTVRGIVEADPYIFVGADSISARGTCRKTARAHIECAPTAAVYFEAVRSTAAHHFYYLLSFIYYLF